MRYLVALLLFPCVALATNFPQLQSITFDDDTEAAHAPTPSPQFEPVAAPVDLAPIKNITFENETSVAGPPTPSPQFEPVAAPVDLAPIKNITFEEDTGKNVEPKTPPTAQGYSVLSAHGTYGLQRIVSRDKTGGQKADLSSEPSFGANLSWKVLWSDTWSVGARISHQTISFRKFGSGDLANKSIRLGDVELSSEARLGEGVTLRIAGGQKTLPIVRAKTAGVATIDTPIANYAGAGIAATLLRQDKLSLGVLAGYNSIFGLSVGSYKLKTSPEYYVGPTFTQRLKDAALDLKVIYLQQDSETSITKQRASSLAAIVGMSFEVGK